MSQSEETEAERMGEVGGEGGGRKCVCWGGGGGYGEIRQ